MRDPNRIEPFMEELGHIWKTQCPDWRFGQLMFNVQRVLQTHNTDIFYMEDDELLQYIKEWFDIKEDKHDAAKRKRRKVCSYPERRIQ